MVHSIEQLQRDFTDQYVVVDARVPELRRFEGHVGQVKTVNMSGRALVQFDAWNNIGWYDIDPGCLKIVPKPDATSAKKPEAKKEAPPAAAKPAAAAGGKKLSPLEMARMQGAAKGAAAAKPTPSAGGKASTADILAAARAGKGGTAAAGGASKPAAAPAPSKPAAPTAGKMSTAEILAAARAKASGEAAAGSGAAPAAAPAAAPKPAAAEKPAKAPAGGGPTLTAGVRPSVSEILAWCRAHDTK